MTHTAKHMPGPWVVDETVSEDNAGQPTLGIYADGAEAFGYIAGIHCGPDAEITDVDHANAHLIAAAPAMYEALSQVQAFIKTLVEADVLAHPTKLTDTITNALAQAEGVST